MGIMFYGTGINEYQVDGKIKSTHAEINASNSLKYSKKKRKKKINFCVFTTNKHKGNKLITSRPCYNCLFNSFNKCLKKGYIIQRYYYFDDNNELNYYSTSQIKEMLERREVFY